jgi:WD40 repeat protein
VAALLAGMVVLVAVGTGLVTWQWRRAVAAGQAAETARHAEEAAHHAEEAQRRKVEDLLIRFYRERGQTLCEQGDIGRGMLWLARTLDNAKGEDLRRAVRADLAAWHGRLNPLRELLPHPAAVNTALFSPDGRTVLTLCEDNRVRLWDAATGEPRGSALEHPDRVHAVACSPDGQWVVTACEDGAARLWDAATGARVGELRDKDNKDNGPVLAVAFAPDGKTLVAGSGGDDHKVRLWETATGKLLATAPHQGSVLSVACSPDGKTVVSGGADGWIKFWDAATLRPAVLAPAQEGERATPPPRQKGEVRTVAFSPRPNHNGDVVLLTVTRLARDPKDRHGPRQDMAVTLWQAATGRWIVDLPHHYWVRAVAFSPDGRLVCIGGEDHAAQLYTTDYGDPVGHPLPHQDSVHAIAFSPDSRTVLTASDDQTARLWDVDTGRPVGQPLEHQGPVRAVGFSPDGRSLLTASQDGTGRLWQPAPAEPYLREFACEQQQVMSVAWSPAGDVVATGTDSGLAWLWRVETGQRLEPPFKNEDEVWVVAFDRTGRKLLTGGRDKVVHVWNVKPRWQTKPLSHEHRVRSAAFSPDGRMVLTGAGDTDEGEALLWDAQTGASLGPPLEERANLRQEVVGQVAFSPDGHTCATASGENSVRLWDVTNPTDPRPRLLPAKHQTRVVALAFSPDGRLLLTGSTDKTARLWDVATAQPAGEPLQHPGAVWSVAFSADGRFVVTGCRDGTARVWDAATGVPVGPPWPHGNFVWAVACQPNGRLVLTGSADHTARLWQLPEPVAGDAEQIRLWVAVSTAMELDDNGATHWLDAAAWKERRRQLEKNGGPPLP